MTIQTLTLEGVKRACRRAYRAKKLLAQHPVKAKRECVYVCGKYGCAIGVAMTDKTRRQVVARHLNEGYSIGPILHAPSNNFLVANCDLDDLFAIQKAHDNWATASRTGGSVSVITGFRNAFLNLIDYPATKA